MRSQLAAARLALVIAALLAQEFVANADSAVILGSGHVGSWFTAGYVANPRTSAVNLVVAPFPLTSGGPCPGLCPISSISIAALGADALRALL